MAEKNFAEPLCSKEEFNQTISGIVNSFLNMSYSQQKKFFEALIQGWPKNAFPSTDRETVGAIFELAKMKIIYGKPEKANKPQHNAQQNIFEKIKRIGDDSINFIWKCLESYVYSLIKKKYPTYLTKKELCEDIISNCKLAVYGRIPAYDAYRSTPITFFNNELLAAIRNEITFNASPVKQTSYHISRQSAIKRVMSELKQEGLNPDDVTLIHERLPQLKRDEIIAEKEMMEKFSVSNMVFINNEDAPDIPDDYANPEKAFLKQERAYKIRTAIKTLSDLDQKICMMLMQERNPESNEAAKNVAFKLGISMNQFQSRKVNINRHLGVIIESGALGDDIKRKFAPQNINKRNDMIYAMEDITYDEACDVMNDEIICIDLDDNNDIMSFLGEDGRECFTKTETGTQTPNKYENQEPDIT